MAQVLYGQEFENPKHKRESQSFDHFPHQAMVSDSSVHNLGEFCSRGHVHGHFRNYFMATVHPGIRRDFWTNATGGSFGYQSAIWKGFQFGIKGIFTYKTLSSDLLPNDSLDLPGAMWELQLYDVTRPTKGDDLDRLEELFLRYYYKPESFVEYGKLDINEGPLLLRRDGRMKAFVYKGLWANHRFKNNSLLKYGFIQSVSPRGMTEWYPLNEAIGINNNGLQPDGSQAHYHEKSNTRGLAVLGITDLRLGGWTFQAWNYYFDRISDMTWLEGNYEGGQFFGGLQYVAQFALPHQATLDYAERYMQPDEEAHVLSGKAGMHFGTIDISANVLHAFGTGRFLFPKELGRENFFVSQSRSRIDGLGDSQVYMLRIKTNHKEGWAKNILADVRLSYFDLPSRKEPRFNKYEYSSFYQGSLLFSYHFPKAFEGMEFVFMYTTKEAVEGELLTHSESLHRSNFHHFNFVTNIHF